MDRRAGVCSKLAAHENGGRLHRAFSVFIFDPAGRMLLQRRSADKYHFGGLWTNACCGHPRPGEDVSEAASRRLFEEMGIVPELTRATSFVYEAFDPQSGLTEREYDHVFHGRYDGEPEPDPDEADGWTWIYPEDLAADLEVERREAADRRNQAEQSAYSVERLLQDNGDKLPEDVKTEVQADVDALKAALEKQDNDDEVAAAFEKLQASQVKIGEALYAQQGAESADAGAESAAPQGDDEDIVDAEVVDEDDEKKA